MKDHQQCRFCGAPLSPKSHEICGAVACLHKRNAEAARQYMALNRERVNEQRRLRYHQQQQTMLTAIQGAALQALWREGHLLQYKGSIVSATSLHHVCALSTIKSLAEKGLAVNDNGRWTAKLQPDEFTAQGYTISSKPRHKS